MTRREFSKLKVGTPVLWHWVYDGSTESGVVKIDGIEWSDGQFTDYRDEDSLQYVELAPSSEPSYA